MNVLIVGDIVGRTGRRVVKEVMRSYRKKYQADFVIANGENAAGGNGITREIADELFEEGIDFITMGNHTWDKKEILQFIEHEPYLIRPANYPPDTPGKGSAVIKLENRHKIGVINLSGRVFMTPLDCPFRTAEALVKTIAKETPNIIIDFHGEATSEKIAFAWYMDGKVSAVIGTHTHVQTADERILPQGTGYITDVGMTGPQNSVLGVRTDLVIQKFLTQMPVRFEVAEGTAQLNGLFLRIDEKTGKTMLVERINQIIL